MTRDETKKILMSIECSYPNWKPHGDLSFMVDIWCDDLKDFSYEEISTALKAYKTTNTSGFAPDVGQLINKVYQIGKNGYENPLSVWGKVIRAIQNSSYDADTEFAKLPKLAQKVIGNPTALHTLAMNKDFNEDVEKAMFVKEYRKQMEEQEELDRLPNDIKAILELEDHKISGLLAEE